MANDETVRVSLKRRTKMVEIEDEQGALRVLHIRELSSSEKDEYSNLCTARPTHPHNGKPVDVRGLDDAYVILAARDSEGKKLDPGTVAAWPAPVRELLLDLAIEVNAERLQEVVAKKAQRASAALGLKSPSP